MKLKTLFISAAAVLILWTGCKEPEVQEQTVTIDEFLSKAVLNMAKSYQGFDVAITQALFMKQVTGVANTAKERYDYSFKPENTDNLWNSIFLDQLKLLDTVCKMSRGGYYKAVAEILQAQAWATATDLFDQVPYNDIFQSLEPRFDSQEEVYKGVFELLDDAINIINSGQTGNVPLGSGDVLYHWDMNKWLKFAYGLKARYAMRLSKVQAVDYQQVIDYVDMSLSSALDEPRLYFSYFNQTPPLNEYVNAHKNDFKLSNFFYDILDSLQDPRFTVLQYDGFWAQGNAYFPFIQYTELLLIKSEAYYRLGDYSSSAAVLKQAVEESLKKYYVPDYTAWYNNFSSGIDTLDSEELFDAIALQKFLDLVYSPECYSEWRRLDYPVVPPEGDNLTPPLRYPWPKNELDVNDNAPEWDGNHTIFDPVWWDK